MKSIFLLLIYILFIFNLFSIHVSGHISEDTTWSPNNNPYEVVDNVFVDEDVTLSILPGTVVRFNSTILADIEDFSNFIYNNGSNLAKMLWIDGRVIAEGTEEEPITFTRAQDELYYHWGVIYITEFADRSIFKYCNIEYAARMIIVTGIMPIGAISTYNEEVIIENCNFIDNLCGVHIRFYPQKVIINNNHFYNIENFHPDIVSSAAGGISIGAGNTAESGLVLIAGNRFNESDIDYSFLSVHDVPFYAAYNQFNGAGIFANINSEAACYFYKNNFVDCTDGINGGDPIDSFYIKSNRFIGGYNGLEIHHGYVEISDNYFEDCDVFTQFTLGKVFNNISKNGEVWTTSDMEAYNNICYNSDGYGLKVGYNPYCANNISINNQYAIWGKTVYYDNCIILYNSDLTQNSISGEPIFRNCIVDFPIEPPLIDGGGNIIVDSLQTQHIFEDIQNGDFHLVPGSIAVDAGFDTLSYYYPFDMDYNHRVWDGDNNGSAIIDIGPYEFGSSALGGIQGITYNPVNGDPVDYVLIKINNEPGEFTFSDSLGEFEFKLPSGIYDIYAERVFYDDMIEYQIEVIDGEYTTLSIAMSIETVDVEENEIQHSANDFNLTNYPNPCNPSTNISFTIQHDSNVELYIFNIKGQKIATLINEQMQKGKHSITWFGLGNDNKPVSSGIYLYKIKADNQESVKRMILLK